MFDYTQSEFIDNEKFESDFYFEYMSMLRDFQEKEELDNLQEVDSVIDFDIDELPF